MKENLRSFKQNLRMLKMATYYAKDLRPHIYCRRYLARKDGTPDKRSPVPYYTSQSARTACSFSCRPSARSWSSVSCSLRSPTTGTKAAATASRREKPPPRSVSSNCCCRREERGPASAAGCPVSVGPFPPPAAVELVKTAASPAGCSGPAGNQQRLNF